VIHLLNAADLILLVTVVVGPLSGIAAAHGCKAGVLAMILFGLGGFLFALGLGLATNKLANKVLRARSLPESIQVLAYMFIPMPTLLVVLLGPLLVAHLIYG